jgi:hypothetical protein
VQARKPLAGRQRRRLARCGTSILPVLSGASQMASNAKQKTPGGPGIPSLGAGQALPLPCCASSPAAMDFVLGAPTPPCGVGIHRADCARRGQGYVRGRDAAATPRATPCATERAVSALSERRNP